MRNNVMFLMLVTFCASLCAGEFVVVVNKDNAISTISKADLKRIFTGKKTDLGGGKAVPMNQTLESPIATSFLKDVVGMSPEEYKEFWVAEGVKGGASAPMVQKSAEMVVAMVSQLPGGIGYVEKDKVTDAVKVVAVQ